jgi:hypothetical protein
VAMEELGDLLGNWDGVHIKNHMNQKFTTAIEMCRLLCDSALSERKGCKCADYFACQLFFVFSNNLKCRNA